jgi:methylenetetrahydrofolate reductase (NADPH)
VRHNHRYPFQYKTISIQRHLQILPQIFRIDLPEDLIDIDACKQMDKKQVELNGPFSNHELKAAGVPVLHYYSMGKSENIRQIAVSF